MTEFPPVDSAPLPLVAARLTPRGRGAVATIAVRGDLERLDRYFRAKNGLPVCQQELGRICFGEWGEAGSALEELVVCRVAYDEVEIHCHGGGAAVARVLDHLTAGGAEVVSAFELQRTARSLVDMECETALTRATTERTVLLLLEQCRAFPAAVKGLGGLPSNQRETGISNLLRWSDFGIHLSVPWKVVLCGRPNVGKSSLINRLVGYNRAVVFDQPGTTRDVLAAQAAFAGWPVELIDTAGQRASDEELEAAGILKAKNVLGEADLVVLVGDATAGWTAEDQRLLTLGDSPLLVWNKVDLTRSGIPTEAVAVSAHTGEGMEELMRCIVGRLVPELPPPGAAYPVTVEQKQRLQELRDFPDDDDRWQRVLREWTG